MNPNNDHQSKPIYAVADFLEDGFVAPLDAGFVFFEAGLAVFVVDLDLVLAAAAFAAVFLASLFALVVFFVDGFFAAAVFLVAAGAFFGAETDFFVVAVLFPVALDLPRAAFFAGAALVVSVLLDFLEGGWAFSLASAATLGRLGASLTLPDGPLGKINVSFSAPRVSARLS